MNSRQLKILVFMPDNGGSGIEGTTADAINMARSFAMADVPSIFVFNGRAEILSKLEETGVDARRMAMPASGVKQRFNPFYRRRFSRQLSEFIRRERIDVLHLAHGAPNVLNYLKSSPILKVCVQQGATPDFSPTRFFESGFSVNPKRLLKA
jgi:hypothetical protein